MIKDLVKGAVHIKMGCTTRNDLISKGEFSYAAGYILRTLQQDQNELATILGLNTIQEIKAAIIDRVRPAYEKGEYSASEKTLFYMMIECKLEGEMDEELRELIRMGYQG